MTTHKLLPFQIAALTAMGAAFTRSSVEIAHAPEAATDAFYRAGEAISLTGTLKPSSRRSKSALDELIRGNGSTRPAVTGRNASVLVLDEAGEVNRFMTMAAARAQKEEADKAAHRASYEGMMQQIEIHNLYELPKKPPHGHNPERAAVREILRIVVAGGEITQTMIDAIELAARRIKRKVRDNLANVLLTVDLIATDLAGVCRHSVNEFAVKCWPKPSLAEGLDAYLGTLDFQDSIDAVSDKLKHMALNGQYIGESGKAHTLEGALSILRRPSVVGEQGCEVITPKGSRLNIPTHH